MEFSKIFLFAIFLAITIIPVALYQIKENSKNQKAWKRLKESTSKDGATISAIDKWSFTALAIDETKGLLYYSHFSKIADLSEKIDLKNLKNCVIDKQKNYDRESINLVLSSKENTISLPFYDSNNDGFVLSGQLQLAEKWKKIINSHISNK